MVHEFHDFLEERERKLPADVRGEELMTPVERKIHLEVLEDMGGKRPICYKITSGSLRFFNGELPQEVWYDKEKIRELRDELSHNKEMLEKEDDETNWELTFELKHIALCEFALENDLGVTVG